MSQYTKPFIDLTKADARIAGGKGASLGEMTNAGIPVPPGFVVVVDAFEHFIRETDLIQEIQTILDTVNPDDTHTIEMASEQIQALILNAEIPDNIKVDLQNSFKDLNTEWVAVRSSATAEDSADHAWAGQLDSYLNVRKDEVEHFVQKCWASLFTPRAIFYRFEKGLHTTHISVAVVVQKMVNSQKSGIAFSVHPVTEDYNQLIIEAGFGLGEAIVSGSITPDSYVVTKDSKEIIDINISEQSRALYRSDTADGKERNTWKDLGPLGHEQVLTNEQILELSDLIIKIENHYSAPQDIEWAMEGERFYIVQSRPITTLKKNSNLYKSEHSYSDEFFLQFQVRGIGVLMADILNNVYGKYGSMSFSLSSVYYEGLYQNDLNITAEIGKKVFNDTDEFTDLKNNLKEKFSLQRNYNFTTKGGVKDFFRDINDLLSTYSKLDPLFTEKISVNDKGIVKEISEIKDFYRLKLNNILFTDDSLFNKLIITLSDKFKLSLNDLRMYKHDEVLDLFKGMIVKDIELSKRKESYFFQKGNFWSGHDAKVKVKEIIDSWRIESNLRGQAISGSGKTAGRVKILEPSYEMLTNSHDLSSDKGVILVATSTGPEHLPLIKQASGIVTNAGGMLSHAAIVSRELGIPCIVGTKVATQVLKDGDLVEVDADNGMVRILERKKTE